MAEKGRNKVTVTDMKGNIIVKKGRLTSFGEKVIGWFRTSEKLK